ncbi:hypothetical protein KRX56_03840 [Dermabacteraceae bacterium TAE3-ERU27]|nr:hypothetical protein [Dermabacteraceae bacterium TAE3-ERU27]
METNRYRPIARVLSVLLLVGGMVLIAGGLFTHSQVSAQLAQEKISMPQGEAIAKLKDESSRKNLEAYAGQQLTTGPQAKAFADHFVWQHLMAASGGKTYAEVSGELIKKSQGMTPEQVQANPELNKLQGLKQQMFMGNSLRGMLLNAYAWWTAGSVCLWGGMALAGLALAFGAFGFFPRKR